MVKRISAILIALVIGISSAIAQDAQLRNVPAGQRMKLRGVTTAILLSVIHRVLTHMLSSFLRRVSRTMLSGAATNTLRPL
ncbi:MAG: hypothetical protein DMF62_15935 [Acidobacteria bacterium]|nr:MAG: hypothetical protein DMF62_15935 [Acidobacteriota bacterium]